MANITIQEVRQKYPQYNALSDQDLADKLHAKYYSELPKEDFYSRVGFEANPESKLMGLAKKESGLAAELGAGALQGLGQLGQSIINAPYNITKTFAPEFAERNIPHQPKQDYGQMVSNITGVPQSTAGDISANLTENLPSFLLPEFKAVGPLAKVLGSNIAGAAGRIAPQTAYGFATGEEPIKKAKEFGGIQTALEAIPLAGKAVGKAIEPIRPTAYMHQMLDRLSGGQTTSENAKLLADSIKNTYQQAKQKGGELYDAVFLHPGVSRGLSVGTVNGKQELEKSLLQHFDTDLKDVYKNYTKDPSLKNADALQSQLGSSLRDIESKDLKSGLNAAERNERSAYKKAQAEVRNRIYDNLEKVAPELPELYNKAASNWAQTVVPYKNPKLLKIAEEGRKASFKPHELSSIFQNADKEGTLHILENLGEEGKNRLLFNVLGKNARHYSPEQLGKALGNLSNEGYGHLITPEFLGAEKELANRVKYRDIARQAASIGGGAALGLSHGPVSAIASGAAGALAGPWLGALGGMIPAEAFAQALSPAYRPAGRAAALSIMAPEHRNRK